MKNWIIGTILTVIVLIGAAVISAPYFVDINQYKGKITEQLEKATGFDVVFNDEITLGVLPMPHVSAKNIVINNKAGFSNAPLAKVAEAEIYVALAPLLSKRVDVQSITLTDPDINLEVKENGEQNWAITKGKGQDDAGEPQNKGANDKGGALNIRQVTIENGRLSYKNANADPIVVKDIDVTLNAGSLQGPFDVEGALSLYGQSVSFDGNVKKFDTLSEPLSVAVKASVSPTDASVDFDGVIDVSAKEAQGRIEASHPQGSVRGMMNATQKAIAISDMQASAMGIDATGVASVAMDPVTLKAQVKSNGSNLNIVGIYKDTLNIVASADVLDIDAFKFEKLSANKGVSNKDDQNNGKGASAKPLPINFDVSIDKLFVQKTPVQSVKAKGTLSGDTLRLASASIGDYAGLSVNGNGLIKNIKMLSGVDVKATGDIKNVKTFANAMKIDTKALPDSLKTAAFNAVVKSDDGQTMRIGSDIKALGGTYGLKTAVLRDKPVFNAADLTIVHPNFANLVKALSPDVPQYDTLQRPANITLRLEKDGKSIDIKSLKGSVGNTTLAGNVSMNTAGSKPDIKGDVVFGDLSIKSSTTGKAGGNDTPSPNSSAGKWSSAPMNSAWLNSADVDLNIKAERIVYETWDMRKPSIDFAMKNGVLNIQKLSAGLYGGTLALSGTIKSANDKDQGLNVQSDIVFNDVDLESLAGSFVGTKILKTDGKASLQTKINGAGISQKALVSSLSGSGAFNGDGNITIQGFDIAQFTRAMSLDNKPGDTVTGLFQSAGRSGSTVFNTLKGGYAIKQGIVTLQGVSLDGPSASVASKGAINLPSWTLDTTHTITAKGEGEDLPTFDVVVKGSLNNPAQNIAQGALQNYLQKKLGRKLDKVLSDKLDLGDGDGPIEQKLFDKFVGGKLNKKLGVEPVQNAEPSPSTDEQPTQETAPQQDTVTPEQAIEGVLKGLLQ